MTNWRGRLRLRQLADVEQAAGMGLPISVEGAFRIALGK
jgi:hypothetical protein